MRPFSKSEIITVSVIFLIVFLVTAFNLNIALRRSRDSQRKSDLGQISDVLGRFHADYGYHPPSEDGKIKICKGENFDQAIQKLRELGTFNSEIFFSGLWPCQWGSDGIFDPLDEKSEYLKTLRMDPRSNQGFSYLYLSNTKRYQLYTYMEGVESEDGYDKYIVERNLNCGGVCSYGKSEAVPVGQSIEDYEAELLQEESGTNQ